MCCLPAGPLALTHSQLQILTRDPQIRPSIRGMSDWAVTGQQQKLQVAELALMEKQVAWLVTLIPVPLNYMMN